MPGNEEDSLRKRHRHISLKMTSLNEIVDGLNSEKVISDNDREDIMAKSTSYERNSALMTCLRKKAHKGFLPFVRLLKETEQDELAELLTLGKYKEIYHNVRMNLPCLIVRKRWHDFLPYTIYAVTPTTHF